MGGTRVFGLKNGGIDWAVDEHNTKLFTKDELAKIEDLKKKIVAGKVAVVDYYKTKK